MVLSRNPSEIQSSNAENIKGQRRAERPVKLHWTARDEEQKEGVSGCREAAYWSRKEIRWGFLLCLHIVLVQIMYNYKQFLCTTRTSCYFWSNFGSKKVCAIHATLQLAKEKIGLFSYSWLTLAYVAKSKLFKRIFDWSDGHLHKTSAVIKWSPVTLGGLSIYKITTLGPLNQTTILVEQPCQGVVYTCTCSMYHNENKLKYQRV